MRSPHGAASISYRRPSGAVAYAASAFAIPRSPFRPSRGSVAEDRVDEGFRLERREVVRTLTEADQLDGDAELALHGHDDAALGGAVELGQHDAGDVDDLAEHARLGEAVLAGRGVEH